MTSMIARSIGWLRPPSTLACRALAMACVFSLATSGGASALTLANDPGDGQVTIDVDGFGSFGYEVDGVGTGDATFDPLGAEGPSSTSWESAVYFRQAGASRFLTTGLVGTAGASGELPDPGFTASGPRTATSAFSYAGLDVVLEQRLDDAFTTGVRTGSLLVQTYTVTNPGDAPASFDLVRYYEGDLYLGAGAGVPDGGGHLFIGDSEYVFQTDLAGEPTTTTNFVGITAEGGTVPATGRFEVGLWSSGGGFPGRIAADEPLADAVYNDGPDPDEFVDAGQDYDVGIALANAFTLGPGEHAVYVTTTLFGTGSPQEVEPPTTSTTVTTSTSTSTTTTVPPPAETCGNCVDDDGDGLTDFEDDACCTDAAAFTLRRARIRPAGGSSALTLRGQTPPAADIAPRTQALALQLRREGGAEILCASIPAGGLVGKTRRFRFRDRAGTVATARGLSVVGVTLGKRAVKVSARGKHVAVGDAPAGRLLVTLGFHATGTPGRCTRATPSFRASKHGAIRYP